MELSVILFRNASKQSVSLLHQIRMNVEKNDPRELHTLSTMHGHYENWSCFLLLRWRLRAGLA